MIPAALLFWCVIQVTIMAAVALCGCLSARRLGPEFRARLVLLAMTATGALTICAFLPLPSWWDASAGEAAATAARPPQVGESQSAPGDSAAAPETADGETGEAGADTAPRSDESSVFWAAFVEELGREPAAAPPAIAGEEPSPSAFRLLDMLLWLPVAVSAGGAFYVLLGIWGVWRLRRGSSAIDDGPLQAEVIRLRERLGIAADVELRQCDSLTAAATIGWRRPLVLLPPEWPSWTDSERRIVLAHELAHIRRRDFAAAVWAQILLAVHFYHPLMHLLAARLRLEQELAADAAAAEAAGGRGVYLKALARMALDQPCRLPGWPARCFLPTRGAFLRRIDMLRDPKSSPRPASILWRAGAVLLLFAAALLVAGLRSPYGPRISNAEAAQPAAPADSAESGAAAAAENQPFDTRFFTDGDEVILAVRPAALMARPHLKPLADSLRDTPEFQNLAKTFGLPPDKLETVMIAFNPVPPDRRGTAAGEAPFHTVYLRSTEDVDWIERLSASDLVQGELEPMRHAGETYFKSSAMPIHVYQPDERTLVLIRDEAYLKSCLEGKKAAPHPLLSGDLWQQVEKDDVALAVAEKALEVFFEDLLHAPDGTVAAGLVPPLARHARHVVIGGSWNETLAFHAFVDCDSSDGAKRVEETAAAALTLARNMLEEAPPSEGGDQAALMLGLIRPVLSATDVRRKKAIVEISGEAATDAETTAIVVRAGRAARLAAQRTHSMNNLKQIGLAMHNYADANGEFPPAAVLGPDGKTPHSWRVALLPYLEEAALYREYRQDEPWDSEHNRTLLEKMPAVYRHPLAADDATTSSYYVLTGGGAAFSAMPAKKGTWFGAITDGTSNTLLAVEAQRDIPWTKPEDIPYDGEKPLPKLGGYHDEGYNAAFCDGAVRFLSAMIDEKLLRLLITRADGQPTNLDRIEP